MGFYNLKALIKGIRACKTVADERALIQQESAAIRASFREEDTHARYHNIAKLLYIHMLGNPAHFGQIECLKLVASPRFADKRLGYLGIMLLLDENQEVLTLVTNSLKNDMNHTNIYAVGLALCTFANIASEEMSRDLANEIEKLLGSSNTYIRKKAALCALRVIKRVPELAEHFTSRAKNLLTDRNHGVLLTAITLVTEMCALDAGCLAEFRGAVPLLVRALKQLVTTGYSPEHDVSGVTDPFLQVKVLRLLRVLGRADAGASEAMNVILAQVGTNTDGSKNVGNSILYETVLTVLETDADSGLRVMAINILGKFLTNRDNNIRYVALNTLTRVVSTEPDAVQRHRNTILDCLRDGDISIRRRALELAYALIDERNVRVLVRELLAFLELADDEFKLGMTTQISLAAERFAPNKRWHIDTVLRVLRLAGNFMHEQILSAFIRLVAHTPELQGYTASRLYSALREDLSQEGLTLAATWVLGEYADVLAEGGLVDSEPPQPLPDSAIADLLLSILDSPYANVLTRQFVLAAATKLASRASTTPGTRARVHDLLRAHADDAELETQQRAVEFASLFALPDALREGVLERMPPPELKLTVIGTVSERRSVGATGQDADLMGDDSAPGASAGGAAPPARTNESLLMDIFGSSDPSAPADGAPASGGGAAPPKAKSTVEDILDLFGPSPASSAPAPAAAAAAAPSFGGLAQSPPAPVPTRAPAAPAAPRHATHTVYDKLGLRITLTPQTNAAKPGFVQILARFAATGADGAAGVSFQAAVTRTQQLQMLPISKTEVAPGATETQQMRVIAPPGSQIKLRLRIGYTLGGQQVQEQVDFAGFPAGLTGQAA